MKVPVPPPVAKEKNKAAAKGAATAAAKAVVVELILGCSKCRGSPGGCLQCRNPDFKGRRGPLPGK